MSCRVEQEKVANELEKLQQVLESKEAQMAKVLSSDGQMASMKGRYDRALRELSAERDELRKERVELLQVSTSKPLLVSLNQMSMMTQDL